MDPAVSALATGWASELVACSGGRPARGSDGAGLANIYWLHCSPFRRRLLRRTVLRTSSRPRQRSRRSPPRQPPRRASSDVRAQKNTPLRTCRLQSDFMGIGGDPQIRLRRSPTCFPSTLSRNRCLRRTMRHLPRIGHLNWPIVTGSVGGFELRQRPRRRTEDSGQTGHDRQQHEGARRNRRAQRVGERTADGREHDLGQRQRGGEDGEA